MAANTKNRPFLSGRLRPGSKWDILVPTQRGSGDERFETVLVQNLPGGLPAGHPAAALPQAGAAARRGQPAGQAGGQGLRQRAGGHQPQRGQHAGDPASAGRPGRGGHILRGLQQNHPQPHHGHRGGGPGALPLGELPGHHWHRRRLQPGLRQGGGGAGSPAPQTAVQAGGRAEGAPSPPPPAPAARPPSPPSSPTPSPGTSTPSATFPSSPATPCWTRR